MAKDINYLLPGFIDFMVTTVRGAAEYEISQGRDREEVYRELAQDVMKMAHRGQYLRSGEKYENHPKAVASGFDDDLEIQLALLHDIVENSNITVDHIAAMGFHPAVVNGLRAMTKLEGEPYLDYVVRVSRHYLAARVKPEDFCENNRDDRQPETKIKQRRVWRRESYRIGIPFMTYVNWLRDQGEFDRADTMTISKFLYETNFVQTQTPDEIQLIRATLLNNSSEPLAVYSLEKALNDRGQRSYHPVVLDWYPCPPSPPETGEPNMPAAA